MKTSVKYPASKVANGVILQIGGIPVSTYCTFYSEVKNIHTVCEPFTDYANLSEILKELGIVDDSKFSATIYISPHSEGYLVKSQVAIIPTLECYRCSADISDLIISEEYTTLYIEGEDILETDAEEIDIMLDETDKYYYKGFNLPFDELISDSIFLTIPEEPICKEGNCIKVCAKCGKLLIANDACDC